MPSPLLYDAVTLRHFAFCGRLDICETLHIALPTPRWTEEVQGEITRAAAYGAPGCAAILAAGWLGSPIIPNPGDLRRIYNFQVALNHGRQPPSGDAGEAQSIYFADVHGGVFATDDNVAYDFAERRLGSGRVVDTVQILREAVVCGHITAVDAAGVVAAIRAGGRYLRRVHPPTLGPQHF